MNSQLREKIIKLRLEKELSYSEIRKRFDVPKSTLSYWLREFPLSEEKIKRLQKESWKRGEAGRERFRATMQIKRNTENQKIYKKYQKRFSRLSKESFFIAGLMLYLGEGDKKNNTRIGLTNTDYKIIKFFIKWLDNFLNVAKNDIKNAVTSLRKYGY